MNIFSVMEPNIKVSGKESKDMAMEFKYGQMALGMRDTGKKIRLMVRGPFGT